MKKVSLTIAALSVMTTVAIAAPKTVPVPPKRPADLVKVYKDGNVVVTAPVGTDVDVDVNGHNVTVTVDQPDSNPVLDTVLPWRWSVWR